MSDLKQFDFREKIINLKSCITLFSLLVIAAGIYLQVGKHDFVNFDDGIYLTNNVHVKSGLTKEGIKWAFGITNRTYWHPVTWISHMLDCHLFGLNSGKHHLTSVALHLTNTILIFFLLFRFTGAFWKSMIVATIFALHPMNVESVAWASERKTLLSLFFWLLTLIFYSYYSIYSGWWRYLVCLTLFAFGLMAKPFMVTLPFVLFLFDYWPLNRYHSEKENTHFNSDDIKKKYSLLRKINWFILLEKLPFFIFLTLYVYIFIYLLEKEIGLKSTYEIQMSMRIANAAVSYMKYIFKAIWPVNLAVFYPFPKTIPIWTGFGSGLILLVISIFIFEKRLKYPALFTGWFWYLGTLVPVTGLIQSGLWPEMADRWAYIPMIGLLIAITWGTEKIIEKFSINIRVIIAAFCLIIFTFTFVAWAQIGYWKNTLILFNHAVNVTQNNTIAHLKVGQCYQEMRLYDRAELHYRKATEIDPLFMPGYNNLGNLLIIKGLTKEAIDSYKYALRISPRYKLARNNLGYALISDQKYDEAVKVFMENLRYYPNELRALHGVGLAYYHKGELRNAENYYKKVLIQDDSLEEAHFGLGEVYSLMGENRKSIKHYINAKKINPNKIDTLINLGNEYFKQKEYSNAALQYREALLKNPNNIIVIRNLAATFIKTGKIEKAEKIIKEAGRLKPDDPDLNEMIMKINSIKNK